MSEYPIFFTPYEGELYGVYLVPCEDTRPPANYAEPEPLTEQDPESWPEWFQEWTLELGPSRDFLEALYSGLRPEEE